MIIHRIVEEERDCIRMAAFICKSIINCVMAREHTLSWDRCYCVKIGAYRSTLSGHINWSMLLCPLHYNSSSSRPSISVSSSHCNRIISSILSISWPYKITRCHPWNSKFWNDTRSNSHIMAVRVSKELF